MQVSRQEWWEGFYAQHFEARDWFIDNEHALRELTTNGSNLSWNSRVLQVGCGSSDLVFWLWRIGISSVNIDFAPSIISALHQYSLDNAHKMSKQLCTDCGALSASSHGPLTLRAHGAVSSEALPPPSTPSAAALPPPLSCSHARPVTLSGPKFLVMDVRKLAFSEGSFDFVIDKGLLDCVSLADDKDQAQREMIAEIGRVLCDGGHFFVFSMHPLSERQALFADRTLWAEVREKVLPISPLELPSQTCLYLYTLQKATTATAPMVNMCLPLV